VTAPERAVAEEAAREACAAGELGRATTILLTAYGGELLGFLRWLLRDEGRGDDAFADCALDAWRGLARFDWRCSGRTWLYAIARRAAARTARARRHGPEIPASESAPLSALIERLRSETAPHLRTDVKNEFRKLREHLDDEEQLLLVLRVDRRLSWREVSLVLGPEGSPEEERAVLEARLRKRFQLVKERLRTLALEAGLLSR
jgi:RNA polymerase sigma-70 factor (ECF subfamily)